MAAPFLPLELITEILTKLPVKSLHRFKCVSKTWNSIINSSKFIKHHLHQTLISNTNTHIIISNKNSLLSSAISTVKIRFDIVNHPLTNLPQCPPVDIAGSVHGVLLIVDSSKKTACLFNPSNKTQRLVPPAPSRKPAFVFRLVVVFGFGYDDITDDYKVVRLAEWELFGFFEREASVYSMRNDSWESVNDETVSYTLQETSGVAVDGILSFVVVLRDPYKPVLKCFDLRTSTFLLVDFPQFDSDSGKLMTFRSLRGCLCLLVNYRKHMVAPDTFMDDPFFNYIFLYADVWEMKDCKWVKLFRVRNNEIHKQCMFLRLLTYSKDEKSVLVEVDGVCFGWYDLVTKRIERVPVQGLRAEDSSPCPACTYVESLVSVAIRPKKTIKKNDFLSSEFKLKLRQLKELVNYVRTFEVTTLFSRIRDWWSW